MGETTDTNYLSAEFIDFSQDNNANVLKGVSENAVEMLLWEINTAISTDSLHQGLFVVLCAINSHNLHQIQFGYLTEFTVGVIRIIRKIMGIEFTVHLNLQNKRVSLHCHDKLLPLFL